MDLYECDLHEIHKLENTEVTDSIQYCRIRISTQISRSDTGEFTAE